MPAKQLSSEQKQEAANLKKLFKEWQAERKARGEQSSQEAASETLHFNQSALSQYLGGLIPLNLDAVLKFSRMLNKPAIEISPLVVEAERERATRAAELLGGAPAPTATTRGKPTAVRAPDRERLRNEDSAFGGLPSGVPAQPKQVTSRRK